MLLDGGITEKKILFAPSGVTLFSPCVQSVLALVCLVSQISAFVTPARVSVKVCFLQVQCLWKSTKIERASFCDPTTCG